MEQKIELLAVILASASILVMNISAIRNNEALLRRLVLNQKKIDVVKNLFSVSLERIVDVEHFLSSKHGFQIRGTTNNLIDGLIDDYENNDTGF